MPYEDSFGIVILARASENTDDHSKSLWNIRMHVMRDKLSYPKMKNTVKSIFEQQMKDLNNLQCPNQNHEIGRKGEMGVR